MSTDEIMPKKCVMCERLSGMFGIALGLVVLLIGIDLLTDGGISKMISGGLREVESDES
jgi:hypothetical protein